MPRILRLRKQFLEGDNFLDVRWREGVHLIDAQLTLYEREALWLVVRESAAAARRPNCIGRYNTPLMIDAVEAEITHSKYDALYTYAQQLLELQRSLAHCVGSL